VFGPLFLFRRKQVKTISGMRRPCQIAILTLFASLSLGAVAEDVQPASAAVAASSAEPAAHKEAHSAVFAVINGREIGMQEYEIAFTTLVRQRFYHGQIPEGELALVREEIKKKLVQRVVLVEEAERRKLALDSAQIDETMAGYDKRYATAPQWQENRERVLPELRKGLVEQSLVAALDKEVRAVPEPSDKEVRAFYEKNPQLFTEPEKLRLAVILLALDPSSAPSAWVSTREEARAIYGRIESGTSFEDAARLHSSVYSESGGDMGYLHRGMMPEVIQERIDKFVVGKVNEPIDTLEGVAIFKLLERVVPKKRDFADVSGRARELLLRERQGKAWKGLVDHLVAKADVKFIGFTTMEQPNASKE
jgi:parvulin-like peptidyl-prolyl isomerase